MPNNSAFSAKNGNLMPPPVFVSAAVEGITDEAVLKRICEHAGAQTATVYGKSGKGSLLRCLAGYNNSARYRHWVILLDLDNDGECVPDVLPRWLPHPSGLMCFRVAVRELEAWILSDPERIAQFLGINQRHIPPQPESLPDPRATLLSLARRSRKSDIRDDLLPRPGSGQSVGPAYASRLIEFVQDRHFGWRPDIAEINSDSLRRCVAAIHHLVELPFPNRPQ
jgi:5S rRNA maturation endonuclease (ribonuclease M5)